MAKPNFWDKNKDKNKPKTATEKQQEKVEEQAVSKVAVLEDRSKLLVDVIVGQAKLLSTGKVRNVYELEKAARELTQVENELTKVQESSN